MRTTILGLLGSLLLAGCGAPTNLTDTHTTSQMARARTSTMSVEGAEKVLADARAQLRQNEGPNPLRNPKTIDDLLAILQSDQIDLFAGGVKLANSMQDRKAQVLGAQIELAWGENERIVAQIVDMFAGDLREERRELLEAEAAGKLAEEDKKRLELLDNLVRNSNPLVDALSRLSPFHIGEGAKMAEKLIQGTPEGYEGYRILADYYRIRGDWANFDAMVKEVEARHPASTGLLFLKGIALAERNGDLEGGTKLLQEALKQDPKFTRAQAQIVFMARGLTAKHAEYLKLKAMNPSHQIVVLAGPVIEMVYENREKRMKQTRKLDWRSPL